MRKITIRGICSKSRCNNDYILTINSNGEAIYQGSYTSYIFFNKTSQLWNWYDHKDNTSVAVRYPTTMINKTLFLSLSCQAILRSPQCCLVSTHLTSLEWREICALPRTPPSWCRLRCPPATLGSSLVMTGSASPLTRDVTRYHTAGNSHTFIEKDLSFTYAETNPMKMGVKC